MVSIPFLYVVLKFLFHVKLNLKKLKELIQIPFIHHPAFNDDLLTTKSISLHSVFLDLPNSMLF